MSEGLNNIDKIFKDAFDGFEANVDSSVWTNVQNAIGGGASGTADATPKIDSSTVASGGMKALVAKIAIGVAVVGTVGTVGYFIADNINNSDESISEHVVEEGIVEDNKENTEYTAIIEKSIENESATAITNQGFTDTNDEDQVENTQTSSSAEETNSNSGEEESVISQFNVNSNQDQKSADPSTDESSTNEEENSTTDATTDKVVKQETTVEKAVEEPKEVKTPAVVTKPKEEPKTKEAQVDVIPNVITPNGDGKNDIIKISGVNLEKIEIVIMDKTGKPVNRIQSIEDEWNGKDQNGYDLIPGIYYLSGVVFDEDGNKKYIKQTVNLLP